MKLILVLVLLAGAALGQPVASGVTIFPYTVATLPSSPPTNTTVLISDSLTGCTTGGGTAIAWCKWNGSAWQVAAIVDPSSIIKVTGMDVLGSGAGNVKWYDAAGTNYWAVEGPATTGANLVLKYNGTPPSGTQYYNCGTPSGSPPTSTCGFSTVSGGGATGTLTLGSSDTITASVVGTTRTKFATSYTIPANTLIAGKVFKVTVNFLISLSATPPDIKYAIALTKAGPTTVYPYVMRLFETPPGGPDTRYTSISFMIQGTQAAGASANVYGSITSPPFGTTTGAYVYANGASQPVTVDTTAAQDIQMAVEWSANTASNSIQLLSMLVEAVN